MSIWSAQFWRAAMERALKTLVQTLLATIGIDAAVSAWDINWPAVGGVALTSGLLSVLMSIASDAKTGTGPSLVGEGVQPASVDDLVARIAALPLGQTVASDGTTLSVAEVSSGDDSGPDTAEPDPALDPVGIVEEFAPEPVLPEADGGEA